MDEKSTKKSAIRKSYKSLINWGLKELHPQIYDKDNITWNHIESFRELHIRVAKRETRTKSSWEKQFEMVKNGDAFIIFGKINEQLVSAGFFMINGSNCYYGVSASRRDLFHKPIFHALLWKAIIFSREIGCRWFELGEQSFLNHPLNPRSTKKERAISEFKAGFGGFMKLYLDITLDCSFKSTT